MEDINELVAQGWLHTNIVLQIVGAPKEHVEKTMQTLITQMSEDSHYDVRDKKLHEPELQEGSDKIFSTFAEIELLVKSYDSLVMLCFEYMPSSIEIASPEHLEISNTDISNLLNDLMDRLHRVDFLLKQKTARNDILERNAARMLKNSILIAVENPRSTGELSKIVGIGTEDLEKFLEQFASEGELVKDGDMWKRK